MILRTIHVKRANGLSIGECVVAAVEEQMLPEDQPDGIRIVAIIPLAYKRTDGYEVTEVDVILEVT